MTGALGALIAALLPERERRAFCDRTGADALRGSYALGAVQVFVGGPWWIWLAVEYLRQVSDATTAGMVASGDGVSIHGLRFAMVALGPLAYLISLPGLGLGYVVGTGFFRLVSAGVQSRPLGDPLLTLGLWLARSVRSGWRARSLRARLGPERPDRLETRGRELRVVAARRRAGWEERTTIQVGERFYRVRDVALRPDGDHHAFVYTLAPLEPGALIRRPLLYEPPVPASGPPPETRAPAPPAREAERPTPARPPAPTAATPGTAARAARQRWRVDEGEEARRTPEGPTVAVVESRGRLPLRPAREATPSRPGLPGTALRLGPGWFEVVSEDADDERVRYGLEPWPEGQVMRETVHYGPRLVRGAQRERREAADRTRLGRRAWPAYPLVGLLPEERQRLVCDRLGLEPEVATVCGGLLELGVLGGLLASGVRDPTADPTGASLYAMLGGALLLGPVVALVALRVLGAAALGTVSGSVVLTPVLKLWRGVGAGVERFDSGVVPLTRPAFWARLGQPDRQRREPDGALLVEGALPHLSWTRPPRLQWDGETRLVQALPPRLDAGRLVYGYRLVPASGEPGAGGALPPRDLYQREVLRGVASDWDDLLASGFAPLVSLLPAEVQRRALARRGGPRAIRGASVASAAATLLVGAWWASGGETGMLVAGGVLVADALLRLLQTSRGEYAPSLFGGLFSDVVRPERRPYQAHLVAEREALAALGVRD